MMTLFLACKDAGSFVLEQEYGGPRLLLSEQTARVGWRVDFKP